MGGGDGGAVVHKAAALSSFIFQEAPGWVRQGSCGQCGGAGGAVTSARLRWTGA